MKKENELMSGYLAEIRKAWSHSDRMMDYFRKDVGQLVMLTNGGYFVVEKSRIETSFCFGYHTDYTGHERIDAEKARQAFLNSSANFKRENLEELERIIKRLSVAPSWDSDYLPVLKRLEYYSQESPLNVWKISWVHYPKFYDEYKDDDGCISNDTIKSVCISDEDREIILSAYKAERDSLNKRLDTYLKRYGTSKLKTWTYWRDE